VVLGKKQHHNQPWISQKTFDKLDDRRKTKANVNQAQTRQRQKQAQQTYAEVHKQVQAQVRTDKRQYMDDPAIQREEAACKGNMKELLANGSIDEVQKFTYLGSVVDVTGISELAFLSHCLWRGLRGDVCDSSLATWNARSRLPIGYDCTFLLALTAEALMRRNRLD